MNGLSGELINQIPGGYFCFTEGGILVGINQTLLNQLGYEASEVVGQSVNALLPIASRIFYQTHVYPLLKLQGKAEEIFLSLRIKNGESLPMLLNASTLDHGEQLLYQCVCLPVRQRQQYEDQILQARRLAEQALADNRELIEAKRTLEAHQHLLDQQLTEVEQKNGQLWQFGKLITHDLQEPLRKIMLLADALRQEGGQRPVLDEGRLLGRIIDASQHMRTMIRRLRDYLLLETAPYRMTQVDLQAVVRDARERVTQQGPTAPIELVSQELPLLEGDRAQLVELFVQLLDNSIRFAHPRGKKPLAIIITGQLIEQNSFQSLPGKYRYEQFVRITYQDNGPGLAAGQGEKLFQIHKTSRAGNLGFGLAMCKKIVDNHGGQIGVNTASQSGAEFIILLPIRRDNMATNSVPTS